MSAGLQTIDEEIAERGDEVMLEDRLPLRLARGRANLAESELAREDLRRVRVELRRDRWRLGNHAAAGPLQLALQPCETAVFFAFTSRIVAGTEV
jgi:hypothetical protein